MKFKSYDRRLSPCSVCICGISKQQPCWNVGEGHAGEFSR